MEKWVDALNRRTAALHRKPGNTMNLGDCALAVLRTNGFRLRANEEWVAQNVEGVKVNLVMDDGPHGEPVFLRFADYQEEGK